MVNMCIRKPKRIKCPYSPEAEWRIAVSRRFNHSVVDEIYQKSILPVLEEEGLVLDCHYAAETPQEYDYWVNRFSIILDLSDIHVLVDIDRTPNMDLEFERSRMFQRRGEPSALAINFGWAITESKLWMRPRRIIIKKNASVSLFHSDLTKVISVTDRTSSEQLAKEIRKAVRWAKRFKLLEIWVAELPEKAKIHFFGIDESEIRPALIDMTTIARKLLGGARVNELLPFARESDLATGIRPSIIEANKVKEWQLNVHKGAVEFPTSFMGKVRYLQELSEKNMKTITKSNSSDQQFDFSELVSLLLSSWWFKKLLFINAFLGAVKITVRGWKDGTKAGR